MLNAQIDEKTENLIKLTLLDEAILHKDAILTPTTIELFFECEYNIQKMNSIGLFPVAFYEVEPKFCDYQTHKTFPVILRGENCTKFVIGINKRINKAYKIFGFSINEFDEFIYDYNKYQAMFDDTQITSRHKLNKLISVKGLDLDCLYKFSQEKDVNKWDSYECFRNPCFEVMKTHYSAKDR